MGGIRFFLLAIAALPAGATSSVQVIAASGRWAALRQGAVCEAASVSLRPAPKGRVQARASIAFDARRHGEFAVRLSAVPRLGASVMLTIGDAPFLLVSRGDMAWSRGPAQDAAIIAGLRSAGGMRVDSRSPAGRRIVDRYDLAGAPTAIDAAAACAAAAGTR